MKTLLELFFIFFKIGAFTFGGGYAMLNLITAELVERRKWCTNEEILDYFALSQCTPGVIAVNCATFVGRQMKGIIGGIVATIGVVTPSFLIITAIASFLQNFAKYQITQHIFGGIRVVVAVLIINAVLNMGKSALKDKICVLLAVISCVLSFLFQLSPIWFVIAGTIVGLFVQRNKKGGDIK